MGTSETMRIVQGYLADHSVEWLAEEIEFRDMGQPEPMRGRDAVGAFLHRFFFEAFDDARIDEIRLTLDDSRACAEWIFRGRHTGSLAGEAPTGRSVAHPFACIYEVVGGEIARARLYHDSVALQAQLAVPPVSAAAAAG